MKRIIDGFIFINKCVLDSVNIIIYVLFDKLIPGGRYLKKIMLVFGIMSSYLTSIYLFLIGH